MNHIPETLVLPPCTLSGHGKALTLLKECAAWGPNGMLVHGASLQSNGILDRILQNMPRGMNVMTSIHPGEEPTLDDIEALRRAARHFQPDWIAAVGGGSVMDAAKTCAGLLHASKPVEAYHNGETIPTSKVPFIAMPTTAGTGSEATVVCVLTNSKTDIKRSIRHPSFQARLVILDPDLLCSCPPHVIANSGMDALTQAIEARVSLGASLLTNQWAEEAVRLLCKSIVPVFQNASSQERADLLYGSFLAGLALSNARLGLVHGLAHPLGHLYHQPHGLVCSACLLPVLEFNLPVIGNAYSALSRAAGTNLIPLIRLLQTSLHMRNPFAGEPRIQTPLVMAETLASGSTKANPRPVSPDELEILLQHIFSPSK